MKRCDVAVIGAGPYGLSATAHLRARSIDSVVFGEPMSFWDQQMPLGMLLRSPWAASHLSDPDRRLTLDAYRLAQRSKFSSPVPREEFVNYGRWFQTQVAPDIDRRAVERIEKNGEFSISLSDGQQLTASRVIVAAGIAKFSKRPSEFADLPPSLISHASEHRDLSSFGGRQVLVIGGGQSALESAALLNEAGAEVQVLVRQPRVIWLSGKKRFSSCLTLQHVLYAPTDIGPPVASQLIAHPTWFQVLPRAVQDRLSLRAIRPAGAAWLKKRFDPVRLMLGMRVASARQAGGRVEIVLGDNSKQMVDHVLLATGYLVDIAKYNFLNPLLQQIKTVNGYPSLSRNFESSVHGLHFIGAPAAWSFGPLMRFVAGVDFAARRLTRGIAQNPCPSQ
jgi:lysine/ornithine N-monooxygenase